jgi:hypothetical protein
MRWLFVALLLLNIGYFAVEFGQQSRRTAVQAEALEPLPAGVERLRLVSELAQPPALRGEAEPSPAGLSEDEQAFDPAAEAEAAELEPAIGAEEPEDDVAENPVNDTPIDEPVAEPGTAPELESEAQLAETETGTASESETATEPESDAATEPEALQGETG